MKTQQDIQAEIQALKLILAPFNPVETRTAIIARNDWRALCIRAQITVLEENMDYYEIYDYYDTPDTKSRRELSAALIARDWVVDVEAYAEGLTVIWN